MAGLSQNAHHDNYIDASQEHSMTMDNPGLMHQKSTLCLGEIQGSDDDAVFGKASQGECGISLGRRLNNQVGDNANLPCK